MINIWITLPYSNNTVEKKRLALIGLEEMTNEIELIHPLSEFILDNWKLRKFNTQRKHAFNIVKFLNYLRNNNIVDNLKDIEIYHCTSFLNTLVMSGFKDSTVKGMQRTLILFLIWLSDKKFISQDSINTLRIKFENNNLDNSNLLNVVLPGNQSNKIEHTLPLKYIPLFIETAIRHANPIALGIYFQFFGGLRVSEVINLNRTQISRRINKGDFSVKVKTQYFRTDLKEHPSVKKERLQEILNINNMGSDLFQNHINTYFSKDDTLALFVNRDGKALSERSYRRYFDVVKREFIKSLENSSDIDMRMLAVSLKHSKWSTHIGRGTYTHMIAEHSSNPIEIAHSRGDSNLDSAIPYFANTSRIYDSLREAFHYMHTDYMRELLKRTEKDE